MSLFGIITIIVRNSTATCLCLQLSNKNFDVCKKAQKERTYTVDGLISGGGGGVYPEYRWEHD